jgi:hypothetical protein
MSNAAVADQISASFIQYIKQAIKTIKPTPV